MITCKRCGAVYPDEATFCNRCNSDLDSTGAVNVYDQQEWVAEQRSRRRARHNVITFLSILCLLFPFLVYFDWVYFARTGAQKLLLIVIEEVLGVATIIGVGNNWRWARLLCRLLGGLLLPLFPVGTVLSIILFYQLIKRDW